MSTTDLSKASEKRDRAEDKQMSLTEQLIVFRLGGEEYALEISQIKEVVPTPNVSKVPLTPNYIEGIANIRGNILAIVNLEKKFDMPSTTISAESYTLVIEEEDWQLGFIVKEVPNTLSVSLDQIDESPGLVQDHSDEKSYIKGIVKMENRLIILLDLVRIIDKSDIQSAVIGH